jgi:heme/copper-type cytochrome/quinol oxidase subunit 2
MSRNVIFIVAAFAVLVVAGFVILFIVTPNGTSHNPVSNGSAGMATSSSSPAPAPIEANVVVPDKGSSSTPQNVATPNVQTQASPSTNASYRSFTVTAQDGFFVPNTIIVKQGDDVDIEITAVGKGYDFTQPDYGLSVKLPEGKTTKVDFGATASGKFTFYCSSCGGPSQGPIGYIEVVPPQ